MISVFVALLTGVALWCGIGLIIGIVQTFIALFNDTGESLNNLRPSHLWLALFCLYGWAVAWPILIGDNRQTRNKLS